MVLAIDDPDQALKTLSQAEEIIGLAYATIADHYTRVADVYRMIASKFNALAEDERGHRDIILKERERLRPAPADSPPDNEG